MTNQNITKYHLLCGSCSRWPYQSVATICRICIWIWYPPKPRIFKRYVFLSLILCEPISRLQMNHCNVFMFIVGYSVDSTVIDWLVLANPLLDWIVKMGVLMQDFNFKKLRIQLMFGPIMMDWMNECIVMNCIDFALNLNEMATKLSRIDASQSCQLKIINGNCHQL